jgi:signal transduction histidine kinase
VAAALRPVEDMRRRAAAISTAERGERLPVGETQDELSRLGQTLNAMLARIQAALDRERQFLDDASHELRTPLALQRAELETAMRYSADPVELRAAIASAIEEVDRLNALADDLLATRPDVDEQAAAKRLVEAERLCEDVARRFRGRAGEEGRSIAVDADHAAPVRCDPDRIERALSNLVDNALRHGGGEVVLRVERADGQVELHVRDRGPGFPPDFLGHAFERFTQADSGRRSGAGLGLAIVERIARAHGGSARAANRPDGGADVWIELPADPSA